MKNALGYGSEKGVYSQQEVTHEAYHYRVEQVRGKPHKCERCGTTAAKTYDWANPTHTNYDNIENYIRMCRGCHMKHDASVLGVTRESVIGVVGENNPRAKLTWESVRKMRERRLQGATYKQLTLEFNVGQTTVAHALNGDTWKSERG